MLKAAVLGLFLMTTMQDSETAALKTGCDAGKLADCVSLASAYQRAGAEDKASADRLQKVWERVLELGKKACDANDGAGCAELGNSYYFGRGTAKDMAKAAEFHEKACSSKVAYSCYRAGGMYEKADGVPKNVDRAIRLYQSACDSGYRNGCEAVNRLKSPGH
jgi:TPR repeat protein